MSTDNHAKGEQDAKNGEYNPPHSTAKELFATGKELHQIYQDREQYREGVRNHKNQTGKD